MGEPRLIGTADSDIPTLPSDVIDASQMEIFTVPVRTVGGYNLRQGNGPYHVDEGDIIIRLFEDGSFIFGQSHLLNYSANDLGRMCPDGLWDARALRWCVPNQTMTMRSDPCDLNMRRFGPSNLGFPYVAGGTGDGTFADLTGLGAGTNIAQVRSTPAAVPYGVGNDETTTGAEAQETNVVITLSCLDMPRRVTNDGQASVGGKISINIAPPNSHDFRQEYFQINGLGLFKIGNKAVDEGNATAMVNIRPHEGDNCRQSIETSGSPTGGTFKLIVWEPPQSDTTFSLGPITGTIAYNASAATIKTAILAALNTLSGNVPGTATAWSAVGASDITAGGGPLPTAVTIEFTGVLATTRILRMGLTEKAFTGGTSPNVTVTRLNQVGIGSQAALHILRLSGCTGGTGDYLQVIRAAGGTVMNLTASEKLFLAGELEIDGALNHDGTTVGLYGVTPVTRATTAGTASTFTANAGTAVNDASTFDGYTIGQVVKALRNIGTLT